MRILTAALLAIFLAACSAHGNLASQPAAQAGSMPPAGAREPDEQDEDPLLADAGVPHQVVTEAFLTALTPEDNIDSPAAWRTPDGALWLLATAKESDKGLLLYDGQTGRTLRSVGGSGAAAGQFQRPNGIAVLGNRAYVVERDNRRVQVLSLPDFTPLGSFGEAQLRSPYGLWVRSLDDARIEVFVTDAYMAGEDADGEDILPPLAELDQRMQRYVLHWNGQAFTARHAGPMGDTTEAGAIRIPESLWGDEAHGRLLVAEEDVATGTALREYSLDGRFLGRTIGLGLFRAQAEGIALWSCPDGSGYWLATDQFKDRSLFHVFDRQDLTHLGAFAGRTTANTDGVWLHQAASASFPAGVFYAVHDDQGVAAFDWRAIARALDLRQRCD